MCRHFVTRVGASTTVGRPAEGLNGHLVRHVALKAIRRSPWFVCRAAF